MKILLKNLVNCPSSTSPENYKIIKKNLLIKIKYKIMLGHIHIARTGDEEIILEYIENLKKLDDAELLDRSEKNKKLGIVGVHRQGLYLIAFNIVMKERFNDSPLIVEDNGLIKFKETEVK